MHDSQHSQNSVCKEIWENWSDYLESHGKSMQLIYNNSNLSLIQYTSAKASNMENYL